MMRISGSDDRRATDSEHGTLKAPGACRHTTQIALTQTVAVPGLTLDFTINTQSDLDLAPVPEPSTLLLFGSSLAGLGTLWRRYRHR
jgi:hypothetical protein